MVHLFKEVEKWKLLMIKSAIVKTTSEFPKVSLIPNVSPAQVKFFWDK